MFRLHRNCFSISLLILLMCTPFVLQCQNSPYQINEEHTIRILRTLSSDEMRGRKALTPDIDRAAEFIASEFESAGLGYAEGLNSYRQEFSLPEIEIEKAQITLNGIPIPANQFFAFVYDDSVAWNQESVATSEITSSDNFRARYNELTSSEEDVVVFVDASHQDIFSRYQAYFSGPNRTDNADEKANALFILTESPPSSFAIELTTKRTEKTLTNLIGVIEGKRTDEIVLFTAHYDHIGIRTAVDGDSIANGANDNASGVTAVIELGNYFASLEKPERTLMFVTFTAEEMGGYGSKYFSKQLNPDEIVAMFNIEMIGKPAVSGPNTAWITGYDLSTFGELLSKSAEGTIYEFYPDPYPQQNLFYRSDNATLARLGVPAHTISTTPIDVDKDYHRVSDEFETINTSHLSNTIQAIAKAAKGIVTGKDTPTRVDTSQVD